MMRELIGARVEFGMSPLLVFKNQSHRSGCTGRLLFEYSWTHRFDG